MNFTKYSDRDEVKHEFEQMKLAHKKVQRFDGWDANLSVIDLDYNYARSAQSWHDIEEGEDLLTREDFARAKEYQKYLDSEPDYDESYG